MSCPAANGALPIADLICCCCFWPELLAYPHTGRAATLVVLSCPQWRGGLVGFGLHLFLSSRSFPISVFFVEAFFSQILVFHRRFFLSPTSSTTYLNNFQLSSRPTDTRCALPGIHMHDLVGCFFVFPVRPSALFVARGRGKPQSQATVGAGLRICPRFLLCCVFSQHNVTFQPYGTSASS